MENGKYTINNMFLFFQKSITKYNNITLQCTLLLSSHERYYLIIRFSLIDLIVDVLQLL